MNVVVVGGRNSQCYQAVSMVVDFHFKQVARVLHVVVSIFSILWLKQNPAPWCSSCPRISEKKMSVCVCVCVFPLHV